MQTLFTENQFWNISDFEIFKVLYLRYHMTKGVWPCVVRHWNYIQGTRHLPMCCYNHLSAKNQPCKLQILLNWKRGVSLGTWLKNWEQFWGFRAKNCTRKHYKTVEKILFSISSSYGYKCHCYILILWIKAFNTLGEYSWLHHCKCMFILIFLIKKIILCLEIWWILLNQMSISTYLKNQCLESMPCSVNSYTPGVWYKCMCTTIQTTSLWNPAIIWPLWIVCTRLCYRCTWTWNSLETGETKKNYKFHLEKQESIFCVNISGIINQCTLIKSLAWEFCESPSLLLLVYAVFHDHNFDP